MVNIWTKSMNYNSITKKWQQIGIHGIKPYCHANAGTTIYTCISILQPKRGKKIENNRKQDINIKKVKKNQKKKKNIIFVQS